MSKHLPPIPPANRSPKGPGGDAHLDAEEVAGTRQSKNSEQQGNQDNLKQNTTHQGLQQDR